MMDSDSKCQAHIAEKGSAKMSDSYQGMPSGIP